MTTNNIHIDFMLSNANNIAKLKIARQQFDEYFAQKNVVDDMQIMMLIDTLIDSLIETHIISCNEFVNKFMNDDDDDDDDDDTID